jgi:hypothetical protein
MKVTYEEIKVHLDLLQGSSIQSKRWMIETYLLLAPAEIALAINTNDDIESLIKEYNSEIETELFYLEDSNEVPNTIRDYIISSMEMIRKLLNDYENNQ